MRISRFSREELLDNRSSMVYVKFILSMLQEFYDYNHGLRKTVKFRGGMAR